jgi:cysteine desulfurase/selenocysteine lyase
MPIPSPITLQSIHTSRELRNKLFPVTSQSRFLAHAGVAPLCAPAADAITQYIHTATLSEQEGSDYLRTLHNLRQSTSALIEAKPDEISLLGPTSLALNLVALGIEWQPGDEIIYYPHDYPANVYPWIHLARRGVRPIALKPKSLGQITPDLVLAAITPRTRLVALASCHYLTGYHLDYRTIGKTLKAQHILFCLDAIQSLGATPIESAYADFIAADSHKWLLGPLSAGFLYVNQDAASQCTPALLGSWNVHSPRFIAQPQITFENGGRRYEPGTLNLSGSIGMAAAIDLLKSLDISLIHRHILELISPIAHALFQNGWHVPWLDYPTHAKSGILTIQHPHYDLNKIYHQLRAQKIIISLRHYPDGTPALRISPHFYNTQEEMNILLACLLKT